MPRISPGQVKIQWVLQDGQIHHVDDYAGLPWGSRPEVYCPLCQHKVNLHLGDERAHHAVHKSGDICAATQPETALHLNCKYHLYHQLKQALKLDLVQSCSGWSIQTEHRASAYGCSISQSYEVAAGWDDVVVEHGLSNGFRPDVALMLQGKTLLALEVVVTHKVSHEKRQALERDGIYWVEINATEEFYLGPPQPWTTETPLQVSQYHLPPAFTDWRCPDCQKALEKAEAEEHWQEELRQRAAKRAQTPVQERPSFDNLIRLADIYYPSGKMFREIFTIARMVRSDGLITGAWLERGDFRKEKPTRIAQAQRPYGEETMPSLEAAFDRYIQDLVRSRGWTVDSPMGWHEWPHGLSRDAVLFERAFFPERYIRSGGSWQPHPQYSKVEWEWYWADERRYANALNQIRNSSHPTARSSGLNRPYPSEPNEAEIPPSTPPGWSKPAICLLCGQTKTKYWYSDGNGGCKCYDCLDQGKF